MINKIKENFKKINFKTLNLSSNHSDGRINSSMDEEQVFSFLKDNEYFKNKINKSNKERNWFDFSINFKNKTGKEFFYPINIKIVQGNKNDNLNCKLGIYYVLTSKIPSFKNEIGWEDYFKKLSKELKETNTDYYFLIVNKITLEHKFLGLREINKFVANGNNLPFQCNFYDKENEKINILNYKKDKKRILNCFYESIKKRTTIKDYFERYFLKNGKIK